MKVKVYLSFDVEMWTNNWAELDARFESSFQRYYFGRSPAGDYALPKTLEILDRHGLKGVFFVEPLFSARFGAQHLDTVTGLIGQAGQDIQLHIHPEWTDEIRPPLIDDISRKRQHLTYYTLAEQTTLIGAARQRLEASIGHPVTAFRAGSYAVNRDTYQALLANGIALDSSLNACYDLSEGTLEGMDACDSVRQIDGVTSYRVTVFRDGLGRLRPANVGACSFAEMKQALLDAQRRGVHHFVIVSHNFELLKPGSSEPDRIVVARFEKLCRFLAAHPAEFEVGSYGQPEPTPAQAPAEPRPQVSRSATAWRFAEQAARRFL